MPKVSVLVNNNSPYYLYIADISCRIDGRSDKENCTDLSERHDFLEPFLNQESLIAGFYKGSQGVEVTAVGQICLLPLPSWCFGSWKIAGKCPLHSNNSCYGFLQLANFMSTNLTAGTFKNIKIQMDTVVYGKGVQNSDNPASDNHDGRAYYEYGWTYNKANTRCNVNASGTPFNVTENVLWGRLSLEDYISYLNKDNEFLVLKNLGDCVYVSKDEFLKSFPIFGFTERINSFGWSLGISEWVQPPLNKTQAVTLYSLYQETFCSDPSAYIALYREPCYDGKNCTTSFSHAALNWGIDYPNATQIYWSSKFGAGPLLTHVSMNSIINPFATQYPSPSCSSSVSSSYGIPSHYGIPALCFKKKATASHEANPVFGRERRGFSEEENVLLKNCLSIVPDRSKAVFSSGYEGWKDFIAHPPIVLSSSLDDRSHGKFFDSMVNLGKESVPLVIEKMMDEGEFMSLLLYEQIAGIRDRRDSSLSAQEIAEGYAHDWLNQVAASSGDGSCHVYFDSF